MLSWSYAAEGGRGPGGRIAGQPRGRGGRKSGEPGGRYGRRPRSADARGRTRRSQAWLGNLDARVRRRGGGCTVSHHRSDHQLPAAARSRCLARAEGGGTGLYPSPRLTGGGRVGKGEEGGTGE